MGDGYTDTVLACIMAATALSITQKAAEPLPEMSNQYNRGCDETAPQTGCWNGNAGFENDPNGPSPPVQHV